MNALPERLRYERKFLPRERAKEAALALARRHPAAFGEVFPPRWVNSLYFDSPSRRAYFDHVNGVANRTKTRLRWYGPLAGGNIEPVFERKIKRGLVSGKECHRLDSITIDGRIHARSLQADLKRAGISEAIEAVLAQLEPVLLTRYHRHYLESPDRQFRLTLDSQMAFFGVRPGTGQVTSLAAGGPPVVLELKYDARLAGEAGWVTNALPFRVVRCSKYVLGVERLLAG